MTSTESRSFTLAERITIGRDKSCKIVLDYPHVSRLHCVIERTPAGYVLRNHGQNGTFYQGARLTAPQLLDDHDEFQVGLSRFVFYGGRLTHYAAGKVHLDVVDVTQHAGALSCLLPAWLPPWLRGSGEVKAILRGINCRIEPNEVVALIGGSGAGKSTLLKALTCFRPATSGHLFLNGVDLYANLDWFKTAVGYVPQDDIVHADLTVEAVLRYAAQLRLPSDTDAAEIAERVDQVLQDLRLAHRKYARVSTLSGGERKRVNVAVELINRPGLIFLDEPTTGLSPDFEVEFVRLLRELSARGHTMVMATHAERCIEACDRIVLLAQGGRLAFAGTPDEARAYFGVKDFAQVLRLINNTHDPVYWEDKFKASALCERHGPRRHVRVAAGGPEPDKARDVLSALGAGEQNTSTFRQWQTLTQRYWDTLRADRFNLGFLLAQPLIIALLLTFVFKPSTMQKVVWAGDASPEIAKAPLFLFWLIIVAMLLGLTNAAKELTKERSIFLRERAVNLGLAPYLASKAVLLSGLCAVQSLTLLFVVTHGLPGVTPGVALDAATALPIWLFLTLACICATILGLAVSALAGNNDQAITLVPVTLLPLFVFSGGFGVPEGNPWFGRLCHLTPSYWAFGTLMSLQGLPQFLADYGITLPSASIQSPPLTGALVLLLHSIVFFYFSLAVLALRERFNYVFPHLLHKRATATKS